MGMQSNRILNSRFKILILHSTFDILNSTFFIKDMKMFNVLLDILLPKECVGCGKEGKYICDKCELFLCETPLSKEVISVWEYDGLVEKLIRKIKYNGMYDIINELVEKAFEKITLELPENTYITYVPMYKKRERERGFNQAELIAKEIGKMTNREVVPLLTKTKDNVSQVGLDPIERVENVKDVFQWRGKTICHVKVVIVDDFWISGATMKECSKVLKGAGAKEVWGFTLARIV